MVLKPFFVVRKIFQEPQEIHPMLYPWFFKLGCCSALRAAAAEFAKVAFDKDAHVHHNFAQSQCPKSGNLSKPRENLEETAAHDDKI